MSCGNKEDFCGKDDHISYLENELDLLQSEINFLEEENEYLYSQNLCLNGDLNSAKKEIAWLKDEVMRLDQRLLVKQKEIDNLRGNQR